MKKNIMRIALILISLLGLLVVWVLLAYPLEYTQRVLRWGNADVYDYQITRSSSNASCLPVMSQMIADHRPALVLLDMNLLEKETRAV